MRHAMLKENKIFDPVRVMANADQKSLVNLPFVDNAVGGISVQIILIQRPHMDGPTVWVSIPNRLKTTK